MISQDSSVNKPDEKYKEDNKNGLFMIFGDEEKS